MSLHRLIITASLLFLTSFHVFGQVSKTEDIPLSHDDALRTLLDAYLDDEDEEELELLYEHLSEVAPNPININAVKYSSDKAMESTLEEQLASLMILSAEQIDDIVEYIVRYGPMRTKSELMMIPSLDVNRRRLLSSLIVLGESDKEKRSKEYHDALLALPAVMGDSAMMDESGMKGDLKSVMVRDGHTVIGEGYARGELTALARIPFYEDRDADKYNGGKIKHWLRADYRFSQRLKLGFLASQDAGEPFFSGRNKTGYDLYSAFLQLKNVKIGRDAKVKNLVAGRFRIRSATGLILNSGNSFRSWGLASSSFLPSTQVSITPGNSRSEATTMQGLATTITLTPHWEATLFASHKKIDATINKNEYENDNEYVNENANEYGNANGSVNVNEYVNEYENEYENVSASTNTSTNTGKGTNTNTGAGTGVGASSSIATLLRSGYHRTDSELSRKHNVSETSLGIIVGYHTNKLAFGVTGVYDHYSLPLVPYEEGASPSKLYKRFSPAGQDFFNVSINYGYRLGKRVVFNGETATSLHESTPMVSRESGLLPATVNSLSYRASRRFTVSLLERFYPYRFWTTLGRSFSSGGSSQDESGVYVAASWTPSASLSLMGYADMEYFVWPKYQALGSSHAFDNQLQLCWKLDSRQTLNVRYRLRMRERDADSNAAGYNPGDLIYKNEHRLRASYEWSEWGARPTMVLQSKVDMSYCSYKKNDFGVMIAQDATFRLRNVCFTLSAGYFNTGDYNARIYSYEHSTPYSLSFPSFYGQGVRTYGVVDATLLKRGGSEVDVVGKLEMTQYFSTRDGEQNQSALSVSLRWRM